MFVGLNIQECYDYRRKFRSQTSDNMDRWKAEQGRGREQRKIRRKKSQKKEDADARKGRKVAKHCVFPMIWGSGGSKSRLAKAAGAEPAGQMRDEKLHAVVARSTFPSQNVQNTPGADHFGQLRCRKSARCCGAKHIAKWKCTKHTILGPLLAVEMSKKCTPLWHEAHFEVKMYKAPQRRTTFGSCDVEKSARRCGAKHISKSKCTKHTILGPLLAIEMFKKCTLLWREAHLEVKMFKKNQGFGPLLEVRMSKKCMPLWREGHVEVKMFKTLGVRNTLGGSDVASLHYITLHYTPLHYTTGHYTTLHYLPLHFTTLHYTPLHSTTLNYTTLHSITLHDTPLHYITLHYLPLHFITLHYTTTTTTTTQLHSTRLNYTTLNYAKFHYTTLHYTTLHSTTLHYTTLH